MSSSHFPKRGDKVNDRSRIPHANGFVVRVLYDDGPDTVMVRYDNDVIFYDFYEFRRSWTDRYGGVFIIEQSSTSGANHG